MNEIDMLESLYDLSRKVGAAPNEMTEEDFNNRFFLFFIERGNHHETFNEELFDQKEPGYGQAMKNAFFQAFENLDDEEKLCVDMIHSIHSLAVIGVEGEIIENSEAYRAVNNAMVCVHPDQTSKSFLKELSVNNYELHFELLPKISSGHFIPSMKDEDLLGMLHNLSGGGKEDMEEKEKNLIAVYHRKMDEIKNKDLSQEELTEQKMRLIGAFIGDMDRLHPYPDGNGRLNDFILCNYLLLQEGLNPCIIHNVYHFAYVTPDERLLAMKEGQEAYKKYFVNGESLDNSKKPLDPKLAEIPIIFEKNDNGRNFTKDLVFWVINKTLAAIVGLKTLAVLSNTNEDLCLRLTLEMKKNSFKEDAIYLTKEPHDIKNLENFPFPIKNSVNLFEIITREFVEDFVEDAMREDCRESLSKIINFTEQMQILRRHIKKDNKGAQVFLSEIENLYLEHFQEKIQDRNFDRKPESSKLTFTDILKIMKPEIGRIIKPMSSINMAGQSSVAGKS